MILNNSADCQLNTWKCRALWVLNFPPLHSLILVVAETYINSMKLEYLGQIFR